MISQPKIPKLMDALVRASKFDSLGKIKDELRPYYNHLVRLYESELLESEHQDYRSGSETYGYKDLESIQWSLLYISDRWNACFRVRWLIDLINPDYCLYDGPRITCSACPFRDGETEEATRAQNLGCLPSASDMVKLFDENGVALSCHDNKNLACRGLASIRDTTNAKVKPYEDWYHGK